MPSVCEGMAIPVVGMRLAAAEVSPPRGRRPPAGRRLLASALEKDKSAGVLERVSLLMRPSTRPEAGAASVAEFEEAEFEEAEFEEAEFEEAEFEKEGDRLG